MKKWHSETYGYRCYKGEGRQLNAIKTKIMVIKDGLNLNSKSTTAANANLLESPLDSGLKTNHITVDIIIQ